MKREEIAYLSSRLGELADYYGNRQPSTAAIKIWVDCLEGMRWDDVASVLTDWPKAKRSFPTGDEVRKLAATRVSERLEAESKAQKAVSATVEDVMAAAPDSPNARAFKRMWRAWRGGKVESPRQWCVNVLASDKADAELKVFAEASLALMGEEKERPKGRYWYAEG